MPLGRPPSKLRRAKPAASTATSQMRTAKVVPASPDDESSTQKIRDIVRPAFRYIIRPTTNGDGGQAPDTHAANTTAVTVADSELEAPGTVPRGWESEMVQQPGESSYEMMSDGWKIHIETFAPERPKAMVLFVHRLAESTQTLGVRRLAHACLAKTILLVAFDAHAHGWSMEKNGLALPDDRRSMIDDFHTTMPLHVVEIAAAVLKKHQLPMCLVGHSTGASAAMLATRAVLRTCIQNSLPFACAVYLAPAVRAEEPKCCACWYRVIYGGCCGCCWFPRDAADSEADHILGDNRNATHFNECFLTSQTMKAPELGGMMTLASWEETNMAGAKVSVADVHSKFFICEQDEVIDPNEQLKLHDAVSGGSHKIECEILPGVTHDCLSGDPQSMKVVQQVLKYVNAKLVPVLASRLVNSHITKGNDLFREVPAATGWVAAAASKRAAEKAAEEAELAAEEEEVAARVDAIAEAAKAKFAADQEEAAARAKAIEEAAKEMIAARAFAIAVAEARVAVEQEVSTRPLSALKKSVLRKAVAEAKAKAMDKAPPTRSSVECEVIAPVTRLAVQRGVSPERHCETRTSPPRLRSRRKSKEATEPAPKVEATLLASERELGAVLWDLPLEKKAVPASPSPRGELREAYVEFKTAATPAAAIAARQRVMDARSRVAAVQMLRGDESVSHPLGGSLANGCGFLRPKDCMREEERELYNAGIFSADTMYCHHLSDSGQHIVLNGLASSDARHCCGVMWGGKKLVCREQRRPTAEGEDAGHDKCDASRCPFIAEGKECPYTPLNEC